MAIETYDLCRLTPTEVSMDVAGSSIEGGRSMNGVTQSIDFAGGGFVVATYGGLNIGSRSQHLYYNRLGAILNGSVRPIIVPLWTDYIAPRDGEGYVPGAGPTLTYHSDHSPFSDGMGYAQGDIPGAVIESNAGLNAGQIIITMPAGTSLEGGEWFAIAHPNKNWRAYRIREVVSSPNQHYRVNIAPPLREAIVAGDPVEFWRPRCLMRLPAGETLPWAWTAPGVIASLSVNWVEAM